MSEGQKKVTPIVVPSYENTRKSKKTGRIVSLFHKKKKPQKKNVEKKERVLRQMPDILPFLQIHEDYIVLKEGLMDILQIETNNLHSKNEHDLNYVLLTRARFLRSYYYAFKEVALNFPANTSKQRDYWMKKRVKTDDPIRLQFIERKLFEFDFLEKERSNREFFLFVYADNKQQLEDRKSQIVRGMQQAFPIRILSIEKKQNVLFLLNNQNTKL